MPSGRSAWPPASRRPRRGSRRACLPSSPKSWSGRAGRRVLAVHAVYQDIEDLVNIGAYVPGANVEFDVAVQARPRILDFLRQEAGSPATLEQSRKQAIDLAAWIDQLEKALRAQATQLARKK